MKFFLVVIATFSLGTAYCQQQNLNHSNPGSLWQEDGQTPDPLHDRTACKEGDIITVVITEATAATFSAQTATTKADSASINAGTGPVLANIIPALGVGDSASTAGSGSTTQSGSFTGTVSAIVKKVFPNGTMLIEGTRDIVYNKDTQTIRVSGIIRREDITPANTILSTQMANASIKASGKGQVSDRQRKGFLVSILDWLF